MDQKALDLKGKRIILELDKNAKQSFSAIAKNVKLSKQVVRLRIKRLEEGNIIEGYYPVINFAILGYSLYVVYLKFTGLSKSKEKSLIDRITKMKNVGLCVRIFGNWDLNLAIWSENSVNFQNTLKNIINGFEQHIIKKTIMIESEANYFRFKLFGSLKNNAETITTQDTSERVLIDKTDKIILKELSENARLDINDLANILKMTSVAVAKRIKNLEKKKIILGYKPQLNLNLIHAKIFLHLQKLSKEKEREMVYFLSEMPEVVSVSKTLGDYELEFRIMVENILNLQNLIEIFKERFQKEFIDFSLIIFIKFYNVLNYFPV